MTRNERKLTDCLRGVADRILIHTQRPVPAFCRAALRGIYETIRDAGVAVLENQPYPPEPLPEPKERPTVVVGVYGGCVQWVRKSDPNVRVLVRDYDVEGRDEQECGLGRDAEGRWYAEWEA
jgi:hypothetical protein